MGGAGVAWSLLLAAVVGVGLSSSNSARSMSSIGVGRCGWARFLGVTWAGGGGVDGGGLKMVMSGAAIGGLSSASSALAISSKGTR